MVSGLISDCKKKRIGIRSMKVDREFFSVGMINLLESLKILFMVPAIKTKGVKKAVKEFESGTRGAVSRHSIESDCGRADFTLIIQKRENGYFTLATNATVQEVLGFKSGSLEGAEGFAELYRLRWGVETAYRDYESIRPARQARTSPCGSCCCSSQCFSTTRGRWSGTCFSTPARACT